MFVPRVPFVLHTSECMSLGVKKNPDSSDWQKKTRMAWMEVFSREGEGGSAIFDILNEIRQLET